MKDRKYITEKEVNMLYAEYRTPPNVIGHCRAVTDTALTIAEALNAHGFCLDLNVVKGSCLVHDAARTYPRHWDVVADRLYGMGFPYESVIVRNHMRGSGYHEIEDISEQDMIWLADRLVKEDAYVGIDERFEYITDKAKKFDASEEHLKGIEESKKRMQRLMDEIGDAIGQSVDSLFSEKEHRDE